MVQNDSYFKIGSGLLGHEYTKLSRTFPCDLRHPTHVTSHDWSPIRVNTLLDRTGCRLTKQGKTNLSWERSKNLVVKSTIIQLENI